MKRLSLYLHIPFCVRKCHYCDFLSFPCDQETRQAYVEAMCREIEAEGAIYRNRTVDTIFLGGGTPSLLPSEEFCRVMEAVRAHFLVEKEAEITVEMNPGTADGEKLRAYRRMGVNRLSIGLQSVHNPELERLGRIHTWEDFLTTWKRVREYGFSNVNLDLMSALPGQSAESWEETVGRALALGPEHISAYSLIIEEGTLFDERYGQGAAGPVGRTGEWGDEPEAESREAGPLLPSEEDDRRLYRRTKELLGKAGYERYEISNYSLPGYECRHNMGYWTGKEYLGLGLGASSLVDGARSRRESDLQRYIRAWMDAGMEPGEKLPAFCRKEPCGVVTENGAAQSFWPMDNQEETKALTLEEQMAEFMFLGLRLMEGIDPLEFERRFAGRVRQEERAVRILRAGSAGPEKTGGGAPAAAGRGFFEEKYGGRINRLIGMGLLQYTPGGRLALTERGIDVSNRVFVEFV